MFTGSYPKPDFDWPHPGFPNLRSLEPLGPPHPLPKTLPTLPSPPRKSLLPSEWQLTTHLIPAASPRTTPLTPVPVIPPFTPGMDKRERKTQLEALAGKLGEMKVKQRNGELGVLGNDETQLWCCVNRYARASVGSGSKKGVTLFFAHANGFPKEVSTMFIKRSQ